MEVNTALKAKTEILKMRISVEDINLKKKKQMQILELKSMILKIKNSTNRL